jgi:hypothetical protein
MSNDNTNRTDRAFTSIDQVFRLMCTRLVSSTIYNACQVYTAFIIYIFGRCQCNEQHYLYISSSVGYDFRFDGYRLNFSRYESKSISNLESSSRHVASSIWYHTINNTNRDQWWTTDKLIYVRCLVVISWRLCFVLIECCCSFEWVVLTIVIRRNHLSCSICLVVSSHFYFSVHLLWTKSVEMNHSSLIDIHFWNESIEFSLWTILSSSWLDERMTSMIPYIGYIDDNHARKQLGHVRCMHDRLSIMCCPSWSCLDKCIDITRL